MEVEQSEWFNGSHLSSYEDDLDSPAPTPVAVETTYIEDCCTYLSDSEFERLLAGGEVYQTEEKTGENTQSDDTAETADTAPPPPPAQKPTKRKIGRKVKEVTLLLRLFLHSETGKKVKKEYLRVEILRGFKRAIRFALDKRVPRKKIEGFKEKDKKSAVLWAKFRTFVRKHQGLNSVAQTESGPCTEAKTKRTAAGIPVSDGSEKTFNDRYCRLFFAASEVCSAFLLFLEVVFAHKDDSSLTAKFRFAPTFPNQEDRSLVWERLQEYLRHGMLQELGI